MISSVALAIALMSVASDVATGPPLIAGRDVPPPRRVKHVVAPNRIPHLAFAAVEAAKQWEYEPTASMASHDKNEAVASAARKALATIGHE